MSEKELLIMMTTKCADLERQLAEAREEFSKLVDTMGYFSQRELANQIGKVHRKLKEKGDE